MNLSTLKNVKVVERALGRSRENALQWTIGAEGWESTGGACLCRHRWRFHSRHPEIVKHRCLSMAVQRGDWIGLGGADRIGQLTRTTTRNRSQAISKLENHHYQDGTIRASKMFIYYSMFDWPLAEGWVDYF
eukprot:scaffold707_cov240-Pinguiococcus_pyrenoidosus.AAC.7